MALRNRMVDMSETEAPRKRKMPSRKGVPATAAQKSALKAGRDKRAQADAARLERRAKGEVSTPMERMNQLINGELSVRDLDDEEIRRGRVHDGNGSFKGRPPRMPGRIHDAMYAENVRRTNRVFHKHGMKAAKRVVKLMNEFEADGTQLRAALAVVDRVVGKVPDVVHVGAETEFDRLQQGVFEFDRGELTGGDE